MFAYSAIVVFGALRIKNCSKYLHDFTCCLSVKQLFPFSLLVLFFKDLGAVVQSIVSLMMLLRRQLVEGDSSPDNKYVLPERAL